MNRIEIENRAILIALAGSRGYGLNRPDSDYDYRGIFIATKPYYLGFSNIHQKDSGWDEPGIFTFLDNAKDTSLYELRKYIELAKDCNPNILEMLWLNDHPVITEVGKKLIENRQLFLSKKVKHTYIGYAKSQLRKIESHRKWLLHPPTKKPVPADFNIEDEPLSKDNINAFLEYLYSLIKGRVEYLEPAEELYSLLNSKIDFKGLLKQQPLPEQTLDYTQQFTKSKTDFLELLRKSQAYRVALREWEAYLSWQKNRNPSRAAMERRCGFDLKYSLHLIRLLKMGLEILTTGEVIPDRRQAGDAEELKNILAGKYTYEEVINIAKMYESKIDEAYANSDLPQRPNVNKINDLCIELVEMQGW